MVKDLSNLPPQDYGTLWLRLWNSLPQPKTEKLKKSFSYDGAKLWNSLPADVRNSDPLTIFKERIRAHTVQ